MSDTEQWELTMREYWPSVESSVACQNPIPRIGDKTTKNIEAREPG
jgi:hypothetical protein